MSVDGAQLLVVDPDTTSAERLAAWLRKDGASVFLAGRGSQALETLNTRPIELVISELTLPDMTALELIAQLSERWPGLPMVVIARDARVSDAVTALKAGAADFIEKPFDAEQISFVATKALALVRATAPRPPPPSSSARASILGESAAMRRAHATLRRAAVSTATVLIRGETGSGKELVARAIHEASPRSSEPFIKIDCASLPDNLLESELFGYERGAFTGAVSRKPGRVELADRGTLFLDEIGELGLLLQAKLLRLLQDRQLERLGGSKPIAVDVRVVAATHRDLEGMIERGEFRLDLFYRLNVVPLWIPPLRARRDDVELLANHFAQVSARANGKSAIRIDAASMSVLRAQRWPGNVRQLQNFIERLVVLANDSAISAAQVQAELQAQVSFKTESTASSEHLAVRPTAASSAASSLPEISNRPGLGNLETAILPLDDSMRAAEKQTLERALRHCKGNRSLAARLLGVSRSTLYAKLHEHGMVIPD